MACGVWNRTDAESISSVVVSPLPHSRATRRKGALVAPAMGANRASPCTSTLPMRTGPIVTEDGSRRKRPRPRSAALPDAIRKQKVVDAPDALRVVQEGRLHDTPPLRPGERDPQAAREALDVLRSRGSVAVGRRLPVLIPDDQALAGASGGWLEVRILRVEGPGVREPDGKIAREAAESCHDRAAREARAPESGRDRVGGLVHAEGLPEEAGSDDPRGQSSGDHDLDQDQD